ncbi:MAG: hypothetical protein HY718_00065 [Planctomycetes bacterium]|nr:hypothetical protein [Planctomycetota bacterium]
MDKTTVRYPKVNLAIGYEVDPAWPQRPADLPWGAMPGLAVDAQDQVWLHTRSDVPVQAYTADGRFVRAWGQGLVGIAHHARVDREGNVWLADNGRHVVRKFTPAGELLLTLGTLDEPGCDETHLNGPTDMAITPAGDVFVSDGYGNFRVAHFDPKGRFVMAWGRMGVGPGEFNLPHTIGVDSRGRLYVACRNNVRVQVFDQEGRLLDEWRHLITPWGMCITPQDDIWIVGSSPMRWEPGQEQLGGPPKDQVFMRFDTQGKLRQLWTVPICPADRPQPGHCNMVHSIAVDSRGSLYVGDIAGRRAQKFVRLECG